MIDTLNMWIDTAAIDSGNPFAIAAYLSDVEEKQGERRGYCVSGKLGDYTIYADKLGVSLKGSLAKFVLPSNVYTLNRAKVQQAIEKMSDCLHLNIAAAVVTRVDVSTVIPTTRPPADYYSNLGAKPYYSRLQATQTTLYYSTQKRQLVFYDKTKEAAAKRAIVPPTLADCNLLRYELRFTRRLQKQLKQPQPIQAAALYNPDFYYMLVQQWKQEFDTIQKLNRSTTMMETIKTTGDAARGLFARLLQDGGGQSVIDGYIADLKARKVFANRQYYTRLKNDLNKILQAPIEKQGDLIEELEKAIANVAKYAR